ncbi:DUF4245 domain-containing protein [Streptomyces sp. NA02950]|uniref:DUF4245 domain-containing protein n=1 Tax=Streptomyces sp. NA02950 TaxID=2742137 RepID=UPI00159289CB|nr:DUF4245 domain-containing protein [Streptomyces sp. NA02950]QKV97600.1 DUF4245 domain-containing protein [Streptomyces sp. NA02950]
MRGKETVRDMMLSMAAIGAVAAGIYVFQIPHDDSDKDGGVRTVDYRVELQTARRAAPYPVAAPEPGSLPKGWRATSVTYTPATGSGSGGADGGAAWHLGFLDAQREYVSVEQSDGKPAPFIANVTQRARATKDTQRIDGKEWVRYEGDKYDALVCRERGVTTVVTGTASAAHLTKMAAALEARKG